MAGSPTLSLAEQAQVKLITVTDDLVQQLAEQQASHCHGTLSTVAPGTVIGRPMMTNPLQRIQIVPADSGVTEAQRIQIVTDQQTGQKIQIVTSMDQGATKQFFITNSDSSTSNKVILARPDCGQGKVILAAPDSAGLNQLIFTSPDGSAQHIQIVTDATSAEQSPVKPALELCVVCGDRASGKNLLIIISIIYNLNNEFEFTFHYAEGGKVVSLELNWLQVDMPGNGMSKSSL
uniref:Uncharacterized protein n=1 Tax=Callorhinchus milii TaxID=7868 RepID=A0A4W3JCG1_CALMI